MDLVYCNEVLLFVCISNKEKNATKFIEVKFEYVCLNLIEETKQDRNVCIFYF